MAYRILEVGPGSEPLGNMFEGEYNWQPFPDSDYTAVQPPTPYHSFPDEVRQLANVTYIERRLQQAGLPDDAFDEIYAANVLSDPALALNTQRTDILQRMGRLLRIGGKLTLLDTYTPEYSQPAEMIMSFFRQHNFRRYSVRAEVDFPAGGGDGLRVPSVEWTATAGVYSHIIRHGYAHGVPAPAGRFVQLVREPGSLNNLRPAKGPSSGNDLLPWLTVNF